ncbi:MAG TPA: DnaJ domain-containing protein [Streptosporangiaceae bacterium]|jgi:DnaJ-class molecular chaperone|nr:DnaJ domain-containing protein [Streptosporangiaceae bacterium]
MTARPWTATAFSALTSTATLAHVEKAHRKLARQPHPRPLNADPEAIDQFRRITEAYEYLPAGAGVIKTRDHQNIAGGRTLCRRCTAAR